MEIATPSISISYAVTSIGKQNWERLQRTITLHGRLQRSDLPWPISHAELSCRSLQSLSILLIKGGHCVGDWDTKERQLNSKFQFCVVAHFVWSHHTSSSLFLCVYLKWIFKATVVLISGCLPSDKKNSNTAVPDLYI